MMSNKDGEITTRVSTETEVNIDGDLYINGTKEKKHSTADYQKSKKKYSGSIIYTNSKKNFPNYVDMNPKSKSSIKIGKSPCAEIQSVSPFYHVSDLEQENSNDDRCLNECIAQKKSAKTKAKRLRRQRKRSQPVSQETEEIDGDLIKETAKVKLQHLNFSNSAQMIHSIHDNAVTAGNSLLTKTDFVMSEIEHTQKSIRHDTLCEKSKGSISVYWCMEDFMLEELSAIDFVKKIRDSLYDGKVEDEFVIFCDLYNLGLNLKQQLKKLNVNTVPISLETAKNYFVVLKSLRTFYLRCGSLDSKVILICDDLDISTQFCKTCYRLDISVTLISNTVPSDTMVALSHLHFQDMQKSTAEQSIKYFVTVVYHLPDSDPHAIISFLDQNLVGIDCDLTCIEDFKAEIECCNKKDVLRIYQRLQGVFMFGSELSVSYRPEGHTGSKNLNIGQVSTFVQKNIDHCSISDIKQNIQTDCRSSDHENLSNVHHDAPSHKVAFTGDTTVNISIREKSVDVNFWTVTLKNILNNENIKFKWLFYNNLQMKFKSLKETRSAVKALEMLENNEVEIKVSKLDERKFSLCLNKQELRCNSSIGNAVDKEAERLCSQIMPIKGNENLKMLGTKCDNVQEEKHPYKKYSVITSNFPINTEQKLKVSTEKNKHFTSNVGQGVKKEGTNRDLDDRRTTTNTLLYDKNDKNIGIDIFVKENPGNIKFWFNALKLIFNNENITLKWQKNRFQVKFKNFDEVQHAKNVLGTQKRSDIDVSILENDTFYITLGDKKFKFDHVIDTNRKKITEQLHCIQDKKTKCLQTFLKKYNAVQNKNFKLSEISTTQEELDEQKIVFLEFYEIMYKKLKTLDVNSEQLDNEIREIVNSYYQECYCFDQGLPIYGKKNILMKRVKQQQVIVLQAETGSGKSTQLCQYLWREGFAEKGMIVCTQPRKIAAISIAKYVSNQVCSAVGNIVGYQVGMSKRFSKETKILYTTDFTMLKLCAEDPLFSKISCVVIDEAHERSIHTDLLVGLIKKAIIQRPDLKVVITSATLKVDLFQQYFSLPDKAVLKISGRTFPIEDIWLDKAVISGWDYFDKALDVTFKILDEVPGDVLIFLTTPHETELAVKKFNDLVKRTSYQSKVLICQLHGKLDLSEQQKIFDKTPNGVRKIVFATNCAETSITIPGIKYVVDSGMVKEAQFDAVRNMNVLTVGFVNRSSAEQRRGRAGRTASGKCYRLYSHSNYENDMTENLLPEILRMNLGQALLKLLLLEINPLDFEFIESPPRESLKIALKQLVHLGAVNSNKMIANTLTAFGRQMALLPLEPRLSYLILKGIDDNIGFEAVVLAAIATVSRNIFFRNSENKDEADLKKMRFCRSDSDYFTFFEIFKEWSEVPKENKSKWCVFNCINGRSMKLSDELINELLLTISQELGHKLEKVLRNDKEIFKKLRNVLCYSYLENLSVFAGHHKLGYFSISGIENLYIHPSSSLHASGDCQPQFVVYDAILKTSRTFIVNITAIEIDFLTHHFFENDIQGLLQRVVEPLIFKNLGNKVLVELLGPKGNNLKALQEKLENLCKNEHLCMIDLDFDLGFIKIFALNRYHDVIKKELHYRIEEIRKPLKTREVLVPNICSIQCLSAVIGVGGEIIEVILPGEYRNVIIKPANCNKPAVIAELQKYGEIVSVQEYDDCMSASFRSVRDAKYAVEMLRNYPHFSVTAGKCKVQQTKPFFKVKVIINRRPCIGTGFFAISPQSQFVEAWYHIMKLCIPYRSSNLQIRISKKGTGDLCIQKLPEIVISSDLIEILGKHLPEGTEVSKLVICRKKPFESNDQEIEDMRKCIEDTFSPFTNINGLAVDLQSPKQFDVTWKAFVYFDNSQDGQHAVNVLKSSLRRHFYSNSLISMTPILDIILTCSQEVYLAIADQIDEAIEFFRNDIHLPNELNFNIMSNEKDKMVRLKLSSNNLSDILDSSKAVQRLFQGDSIECSGKPLLEELFTDAAKKFLRELKVLTPKAQIVCNRQSKILTIYGSDSDATIVKANINIFLDKIANAKKNCTEISLRIPNTRKSIVKELIQRYDLDLKKLCTSCDLLSANINIRTHVLLVRGDPCSISKCREIISEIFDEIGDSVTPLMVVEQCPVCMNDITKPFYRLEYCGHAYCEACILFQFQNDLEMPLCCCFENCEKPIVMQDIIWSCQKVKTLQEKLHRVPLDAFLRNSTTVKYCPNPNCSMVYRVHTSETDSKYTCPGCKNDLCTKCGVLFHTGLSCDIYKTTENDDDFSLKLWLIADEKNHKMCPSCKTPIEKNGGCNHMTCWKCKCHICWKCMETFQSGDAVYMHQPYCRKN